MPRKIELRVWYNKDNTMLEWPCIMQTAFNCNTNYPLLYGIFDGSKDIEIMLNTGLQDKNGKYIYEGDIVQYRYENHQPEGVIIETALFSVVYIKGRYARRFIKIDNVTKMDVPELSFMNEDYIEVKGNIYENPELLVPDEIQPQEPASK